MAHTNFKISMCLFFIKKNRYIGLLGGKNLMENLIINQKGPKISMRNMDNMELNKL
jgi:hypothetical protein